MKIGLDIDNVISNFNKKLMKELIKEDKNKKNRGIINHNVTNIYQMFDFSAEEIEELFCNKCEEWAKKLELNEGAKHFIDKLMDDGDEIYLISHRVYPHYTNAFETTKQWLKDKKIRYTKLIISNENDKTPYCKECKVDIMFDDSVNNCNKMILGGINCYLYRGKNMYDKTPYGNLRVVQNWEELYHEILKLKLSKEGK